MSAQVQTVLLDEPQKADIAEIEHDLVQLWKSAADSAVEEGIPPVVRACTMNLIVVREELEQPDPTVELAGEVTVEHPCRLFIVTLGDASGHPSLEAYISARCTLPLPGRPQVCCEQVNLDARGGDIGRVPSVVTSLLVPDVPSVVLWTLPLGVREGTLRALLPVVDRVLIDSSAEIPSIGILCAWQRLLKHAATLETRATLGDLAWTHLTAWRSLTARMFQPDKMRGVLSGITQIKVDYSVSTLPRHSGLSQSLLYVTWFAERMGWTLLESGGKRERDEFAFGFGRPGSGPLRVEVSSRSVEPGNPGGIESVTMTVSDSSVLSLNLMTNRTGVRCRREISGTPIEESVIPLTDQSESAILARELEIVTSDALYEAALDIAGLMLEGVDQ